MFYRLECVYSCRLTLTDIRWGFRLTPTQQPANTCRIWGLSLGHDQVPDRSRLRRTMAATSCLSVETHCSSCSEKSLSRRLCSSTNSLSPSRSESSYRHKRNVNSYSNYTSPLWFSTIAWFLSGVGCFWVFFFNKFSKNKT